jgi:hypothetical protein
MKFIHIVLDLIAGLVRHTTSIKIEWTNKDKLIGKVIFNDGREESLIKFGREFLQTSQAKKVLNQLGLYVFVGMFLIGWAVYGIALGLQADAALKNFINDHLIQFQFVLLIPAISMNYTFTEKVNDLCYRITDDYYKELVLATDYLLGRTFMYQFFAPILGFGAMLMTNSQLNYLNGLGSILALTALIWSFLYVATISTAYIRLINFIPFITPS